MVKPPANVDPEKFIIGRGSYTSLQTATSVFENGVFRLVPLPMPVLTIIVSNTVLGAFFFGFGWLVKYLTDGEAGPWAIYGAPIGVGLPTCLFVTLVIYHSFAEANRLGPWLIYDTKVGRLELPREREVFERQEIVHLQYLTTKSLETGGERLSDLNLITCRHGVRKRWPLLRSFLAAKPFEKLLEPLVEHTDLPIVRIEDEWRGWNISERPYRRMDRH